jgi:hypothetical protein
MNTSRTRGSEKSALFERPSYQDLIVTPVGGLLLGALLFDPIREHIRRKSEPKWYDHVTLALTDPLGVSNSLMERLWGIQTDIRVQFDFPALASYAPFNEPTARALNGSVANFDFERKIRKSGISNSMAYRLPNARKSKFATEPKMVLTEKWPPDAGVRRPSSRAASETQGACERLFVCEEEWSRHASYARAPDAYLFQNYAGPKIGLYKINPYVMDTGLGYCVFRSRPPS